MFTLITKAGTGAHEAARCGAGTNSRQAAGAMSQRERAHGEAEAKAQTRAFMREWHKLLTGSMKR